MSEYQDAKRLANKVLDGLGPDGHYFDPDSDLAMLSRQFLRSDEALEKIAGMTKEMEHDLFSATQVAAARIGS